ncbi:Predicted membrane protein [Lutibacter agarilyticus]|uniref:Predicted membrane protein n=1 Tax=Lutibacter agarilyticus TaxID=1109740 RepID=A0A238W6K3_9FLAO|nr:DUF2157 domain-containing protein [Lutibacter agarilyticus]SNR41944.1 Predicted membrane protein [Lutibacter agarilyticus]
MSKITREDIYTISQNSNWSEVGVRTVLNEKIYNSSADWKQFLKLLFISLGVAFSIAGIIFFFAYNWASLHKFVKIGLIEGLVIVATLVALLPKVNKLVKNLALTSAAMLVGVLFAVFGQIYQTGANAYDFFLGWTLFITLWVLISNFAPLWLIYLTLINTTLILYAEQVAHDWSFVYITLLLFILNTLFLVFFVFLGRKISTITIPNWFTNIIALAAVFITTIGISVGIFSANEVSFWVLLLLTAIVFGLAVLYSLKIKSIFYISIIAFSLIVIISAFLTNLTDEYFMFLFVTLFIVASVTLVIKNLMDLQKKWSNE